MSEERNYIVRIRELEDQLKKLNELSAGFLNKSIIDNDKIRSLNEKIDRELQDNNGLREYIQKYRKMIKDIDKVTLHAGCMGNPECNLCPVQKIIIDSRVSKEK